MFAAPREYLTEASKDPWAAESWTDNKSHGFPGDRFAGDRYARRDAPAVAGMYPYCYPRANNGVEFAERELH